MRPLIGALTEADAHDAEPRMMTHDQFADTVEVPTGFRGRTRGHDMLDTDRLGHRLLLEAWMALPIAHRKIDRGSPALVVGRTAEAAASHAVERELVDGGERRLFRFVTLDTVPDDDDFERELRGLHRGHSRDAPDEWVDEMRELWSARAIGTPLEAWQATVSVMIRDPAFDALMRPGSELPALKDPQLRENGPRRLLIERLGGAGQQLAAQDRRAQVRGAEAASPPTPSGPPPPLGRQPDGGRRVRESRCGNRQPRDRVVQHRRH